MKTRFKNPPGIVIHHSLTEDGRVEDYAGIKRYHMTEMGMDDIGYHFVIEKVGDATTTLFGRPINMEGGHTKGHNDMIGICVVGNYDIGHDTLSQEKMDTLVALTKNLMAMFSLKPENIHKHTEYASYKTCPGSGFPWTEFIRRVS